MSKDGIHNLLHAMNLGHAHNLIPLVLRPQLPIRYSQQITEKQPSVIQPAITTGMCFCSASRYRFSKLVIDLSRTVHVLMILTVNEQQSSLPNVCLVSVLHDRIAPVSQDASHVLSVGHVMGTPE